MTEPTEFAIVATSFEDLYLREYSGLIAVATALSGRDAEDLVQDAMVRALVSWEKVRRLERPGGWCHRVLVNLCRSRWRRLVTEARFLSRQRREESSMPGPSDDVMAFWSAVRELPERPRLAVALFYAGDRSVVDVARILDVPEGTVRSDLSRARAVLLSRMESQS
ncbi:MAG: sigma-70 family RNA polymerase sigma factor [Ilumatobacteraceae bacterium]